MNMLSLAEIVRVLKQYRGRYRWLDLFAAQVQELMEPSEYKFFNTGDKQYRVKVGADLLDLMVYPGKSVIRCSLGAEEQPLAGSAATAAAFGALLGGSSRPKGPEGLVLGVLLGGLVGATLGGQLEVPNENRIMILRYEPSTGSWGVYHGPYVQWAKEALRTG